MLTNPTRTEDWHTRYLHTSKIYRLWSFRLPPRHLGWRTSRDSLWYLLLVTAVTTFRTQTQNQYPSSLFYFFPVYSGIILSLLSDYECYVVIGTDRGVETDNDIGKCVTYDSESFCFNTWIHHLHPIPSHRSLDAKGEKGEDHVSFQLPNPLNPIVAVVDLKSNSFNK